jgi:hypothetical protein
LWLIAEHAKLEHSVTYLCGLHRLFLGVSVGRIVFLNPESLAPVEPDQFVLPDRRR